MHIVFKQTRSKTSIINSQFLNMCVYEFCTIILCALMWLLVFGFILIHSKVRLYAPLNYCGFVTNRIGSHLHHPCNIVVTNKKGAWVIYINICNGFYDALFTHMDCDFCLTICITNYIFIKIEDSSLRSRGVQGIRNSKKPKS